MTEEERDFLNATIENLREFRSFYSEVRNMVPEASIPPTNIELLGTIRRRLADRDNLLVALSRIAKGEGAFDTDHLTHASNVIDDAKKTASAAIVKALTCE